MPLFHIAGSGWLLVGLVSGATNVLHREVDPAAVLAAIPAHRLTNVILVPSVIQMVLNAPGADQTDFSSLRQVTYGAAPITETLLTRAMTTIGPRLLPGLRLDRDHRLLLQPAPRRSRSDRTSGPPPAIRRPAGGVGRGARRRPRHRGRPSRRRAGRGLDARQHGHARVLEAAREDGRHHHGRRVVQDRRHRATSTPTATCSCTTGATT